MPNEFLASSNATDSYTPPQLLAGGPPNLETLPAKLLSGQNLSQYAVVGRISASGKIRAWQPGASDGSEKAIGILTTSLNASSGDAWAEMYVAGYFNIDALVWPGGTTIEQKTRAFDGSPIRVRHVPPSTSHV